MWWIMKTRWRPGGEALLLSLRRWPAALHNVCLSNDDTVKPEAAEGKEDGALDQQQDGDHPRDSTR